MHNFALWEALLTVAHLFLYLYTYSRYPPKKNQQLASYIKDQENWAIECRWLKNGKDATANQQIGLSKANQN